MTNITEGRGNDKEAAVVVGVLIDHANKLRRRLDDGFKDNPGDGAVRDGYSYACEFSHNYVLALGRSLQKRLATKETVLKSLKYWENFVDEKLWDGTENVPALVGEMAFAAAMRAWFEKYLEKLNEGETDV